MGDVPPMTTDDLRANASKWTLAGDVGLLAHLQQLSETILKKAEEAEGALNKLNDCVEETSSKFHNISNQFLSLQNSQFIENRVYEDDITSESVAQVPSVVPETQEQVLARYKEAVNIGLGLLDSHFEPVDVPQSSDSEDDSPASAKPLLLRPKTAYTKPLPLLIGSAEWWADDSVGLGEFKENEDSESEPTQSDSEEVSRPQIEKRLRRSPSTSSSLSRETPVEPKKQYIPPPTLFVPPLDNPRPPSPTGKEKVFSTEDLFGNYRTDTSRSNDLFGSTESLTQKPIGRDLFSPIDDNFVEPGNTPSTVKAEDTASAVIQPKPVHTKVSNEFTKELAAKLGTVPGKTADRPRSIPPETGSETAQKPLAPELKISTSLFDDSYEEIPVPGANQNVPPLNVIPSKSLFDDEEPIEVQKTSGHRSADSVDRPAKPPALGLFDDDDSEDDLFGAGNKKVVKNSPGPIFNAGQKEEQLPNTLGVKVNKKSSSLFASDLFEDDDDYDDLFSTAVSSKPPKVTFSEYRFVDVNGSGATPKSIKSSTPAAHFKSPADDLFDGISNVESTDQSQSSYNVEDLAQDSEFEYNIADRAVVEDSQDPGFSESTDVNENLPGIKQADWFQPQLSSTHAAPSGNDTTGYKTGSGVGDTSTRPNEKRISSIAEEPAEQPDLFDSDDDDLFAKPVVAPRVSRTHVQLDLDDPKESPLGDIVTASEESSKKIAAKPAPDVPDFSIPSKSIIFDDEDDTSLFSGGKADNISVSSNRSSIFDDTGKSQLPGIFVKNPPTSLFDDVDDDFDLFAPRKGANTETPKVSSSVEKFTKSEEASLKDQAPLKTKSKVPDSPLVVPKSDNNAAGVKPKPPTSLPVTKTSDLLNQPEQRSPTEPKKIGKLNIPTGLKINPVNLLPGAKPVKNLEDNQLPVIAPSDVIPSETGLLGSANKSRARISVKRRPQSRKARHEALRTSGIDFGDDSLQPCSSSSGKQFCSTESSSPSPVYVSPSAVSNPLSPSTDGEDTFSVPALDSYGENEQSLFAKKEGGSQSLDPLFGEPAVLSPVEVSSSKSNNVDRPSYNSLFNEGPPKITPSLGLFEDSDDDDLFKSSQYSTSSKSNENRTVKSFASPAGKNLFGESDEDDDLFLSGITPRAKN